MKKIIFIILLLCFLSNFNLISQSRCNVYADNGGSIYCYFHDTINNQLYVGGDFTALYQDNNLINQTVSRSNIGKIDLFTKTFTSWAPQVTGGPVHCIQKVGSRIFFGGAFNKVNADSSYSFASVDENTGATVNTFTLGHGYSLRTVNNTDVDTVFSMDYTSGKLAIGGLITKFNGTAITTPVVIINAPINNNSYSVLSINPVKNYTGAGTISNATETTKIKFYYRGNVLCLLTAARTTYAFSQSSYRYINSVNIANNNYDLLCNDLFIADFNIRKDTLIILRKGAASSGNVSSSILTPTVSLINGYSYGIHLNSSPNIFPINFPNYPFFGAPPNSCYNPPAKQAALGFFEERYFIGNDIQVPACSVVNNIQAYTKTGQAIPLPLITDTILPNPSFSSTPWGNNDYLYRTMEKQGDKIIYLKGPAQFNQGMVETVCLLPKTPIAPYEINNSNNFCRGQSYQFVESVKRNIFTYTWNYTGTGATITNNGNDTITIAFAYNATPGNIEVYGANTCGVISSTAIKLINFQGLPSISTPPLHKLNCYNNKQVNLVVTSTTSPVNYYWTTPANFTSLGPSLSTMIAGNYIATVENNITGCKSIQTTQVVFDTLKPFITGVNPSYTLNCSPPTLTINPTSCPLQPCNDSLYWAIGNQNLPLPIIVSTSLTLVIKNKNLLNGCRNEYTTTVVSNNSPPTYTMISSVTTQSVGLPQFLPINCYNDSVLLLASANSQSKIKWKRPLNDTVTNSYYAKIPGVYQLLITDTISGCNNNSFFGQIISDKTAPNLILQNNLAYLNCSYSTATLQASTNSPSTNVVWYAPSISFTNASPAITNQQALYYALATNTINGCTKKDSINLQQANTLVLNKSNDSTICNGSSITLNASPIGGTAPFTYSWSNNGGFSNSATFANNTATIKYVITITDNANCVGKDTVKVTVPLILSDSTATFKNCDPNNPSGQIQVFGKGGIPPYRYSINNGISFQNSNSFLNLGFGVYQILIKDTLGCLDLATATISPNSQTPKVDFIINSTMMQADTFVIVDISNPRPDSIEWVLPSNIQIINSANPFSPIIVSPDTGSFYVKAIAHFGACRDSLIKLIHFIKYDTTATKNGNIRGIKTFSLYPNPNTGQFNVVLELYKKQNFVIKINTATGAEVYQAPVQYGDSATIPINMPIITPGNYFIKVIAEFDAKQKGFIISN